jgi:hypothetical protein
MRGTRFRFMLLFVSLFIHTQVFAQDLVVTKKGDVFRCNIERVKDDSILYSFSLYDKTYHYALDKEDVAYYGNNFFEDPSDPDLDPPYKDLIITKNGEVIKCKFLNIHLTSIQYSFLLNQKEFINIIDTKETALYKRSYRESLDLESESQAFYHQVVVFGPNTDRIVKLSGEELICRIDKIGLSVIDFSFMINETIHKGEISRDEIEYFEKDYLNPSSERVYLAYTKEPEEATPDPELDSTDLIITNDGNSFTCTITRISLNTIEYTFQSNGMEYTNLLRKSDVIYYGKSFLRSIQEQETLQNPKYRDLIYTKNKSVLFCNIETVYPLRVEYSFEINKMKHINTIDKKDLYYYGLNIFNEKGVSEHLAEKPEIEQAVDDQHAVDEPLEAAVDSRAPEVIIYGPELISDSTFKEVSNETLTIRIEGVVRDESPIAEIMVNETSIPIMDNGEFETTIDLLTGVNQIHIEASDIHENHIYNTYSLERLKPVIKTIARKERDNDAPEIIFYTPRTDKDNDYLTVSNETKLITVAGNVKDQSGVYEVLVNGRDATLSGTGDFSQDVLLKIGENQVTVQATDIESNYVSKSFVVKREDAVVHFNIPSILEENGKYYGLLIGVSNYADPSIPNLDENPTQDAKDLYRVLKDDYLFEEDNMKLMLNPTRVDIMKTFDRLSAIITEKDNLLIFFAGHGYYDPETELGYWLPADAEADFTANWIYNDVLVANLKRIHSKHTLLISDACFSGSIFKSRSLQFGAPEAYKKKYDLASRKAITSGVLTSVPNKSVFFKFLVDRLESNQEKYMSASELFMSLEMAVANNSPNAPQYGVIQNVGDQGGDFIFIRKATERF